ncbi:MAG TPA: extracellular solute-binding protein [Verrucomicrobiae bacterium]|nr:extracellular solute-binding protein [Verrucomicrobiae bacterium]
MKLRACTDPLSLRAFTQFVWLIAILLLGAPELQARPEHRVIAYCAQDQVYAEPIFKEFENKSGLKVLAVYDNEAVKTVGLANRLLAERGHPVCDVFWGNEEMRTRELAAQNVFRQTNGWTAFGYRSRRMVVNTNSLSADSAPHSLFQLTNQLWRGKLALAYPQFGTTATHFHVLRQHWGEATWLNWCRGLAANKPLLVDGNSEVVKAVARGQAQLGLTDSDDIADGQREGLPVAALPMMPESLLIPNTVAVVRGAPDPDAAQRLFEYLQSAPVVQALIEAKALEGGSPKTIVSPVLQPDWRAVLEDVGVTTRELNQIFLR